MSATTKKINIFKALFGSGIDVEDYEEVTLPKELEDAKKAIETKENEIRKGFNSSSKGGSTPKINPKTEEAMRAKYKEIVKQQTRKQEDREIGDL